MDHVDWIHLSRVVRERDVERKICDGWRRLCKARRCRGASELESRLRFVTCCLGTRAERDVERVSRHRRDKRKTPHEEGTRRQQRRDDERTRLLRACALSRSSSIAAARTVSRITGALWPGGAAPSLHLMLIRVARIYSEPCFLCFFSSDRGSPTPEHPRIIAPSDRDDSIRRSCDRLPLTLTTPVNV